MKRKLKSILLIDDDKATNFLNQMIIEEMNFAEQVTAVQGGKEALTFLTKEENGEYPKPDLILLDINMPGMNGWEFIQKYKELESEQKGKVIVVMLTTSLNPDDEERAKRIADIRGFKIKPLTENMLEEIIIEYFYEKMMEKNQS